MLILTRRIGEAIVLGTEGEIVVSVGRIDLTEGTVRLGIMAPNDMPVDREEVWYRKQREKRHGDSGTQ